jgi:hypothetical protein
VLVTTRVPALSMRAASPVSALVLALVSQVQALTPRRLALPAGPSRTA